MKPPTFSKAEDPLEAEAWIMAIEAKFSAFVMPCSEENKANFTALQLRGEALSCGIISRLCSKGVLSLGMISNKLSRVITFLKD
jgi:hypothetical protein